jgi:hypothetical protein
MFGSTKELLVVAAIAVLAGVLVGFGGLYVADHLAHHRTTSSASPWIGKR